MPGYITFTIVVKVGTINAYLFAEKNVAAATRSVPLIQGAFADAYQIIEGSYNKASVLQMLFSDTQTPFFLSVVQQVRMNG